MQIHAITHGADGHLKSHQVIDSPRQIYLHDFLATDKHFIFLLQPMMFSPWMMLAGFSSFMESLTWKREEGNVVMVLPRGGGAPRFFDAPGAYMWHALNAYEANDEIVADFVGYDAPDHFVPNNAMLYTIMDGKMGAQHEARQTAALPHRPEARHLPRRDRGQRPARIPHGRSARSAASSQSGLHDRRRHSGLQHRRQTLRL